MHIQVPENYLQFLQEFREILVYRVLLLGQIYQVVLFHPYLRLDLKVPICNCKIV